VSVALGGIALMLAVGVIGGRSMQRNLQVARLKTDLVAAVSHELRTPLASMRVLVDGLLADQSADPRKTREYLQLLAIENERLTRLIDNFLAFSRLERQRRRFELTPAVPADLVHAAIDAVRERLPAASELRVDIEPELPLVLADQQGLTTALVNLLDNAIKYSPADKRIAVTARRDGDGFVSLAVSDNGIGIAPREQRRIFRRFYRVDQRLASATAGVGLGLSIVEMVARGHGTRVTVQSEPGHGSTFTLRVRTTEAGIAA
jgi:signal transduction histidine kinase